MVKSIGGLTSHSTRADLARMSSSTWMLFAVVSRRVNSGVRFLLNAVAQNIESAVLNFTVAEDVLKAQAARML